ncbi:hemiasterlin resistant protein 1 [Ditylenchus destructor]|nr:hemiasterlin resistant protein 1 [Ditylenchus destructor]
MPRRSSGGMRSSGPSRTQRSASPPAAAPRPAPTSQAAPPPSKGSGLFGQMAATAGGVAIGSAVGHTIGNMFSGGRGSEEQAPVAPVNTYDNKYEQQQALSQPCEIEWRQFTDCAQKTSDMSYCQSFNDMFKECKARYLQQQNGQQ